MDYLQFYDLEEYLFSKVHARFHANGCLNAFDFLLIVRWKSNRRRDLFIARLRESGDGDLDRGAHCLTRQVHQACNHDERLGILMGPGIGLAMATAILTVLYPEDYTVYDQRACDALRGFQNIRNRTSPARILAGYKEFREAVRKNTPDHLRLRGKDRWLWAKNWVEKLQRKIDDACADLEPPAAQRQSCSRFTLRVAGTVHTLSAASISHYPAHRTLLRLSAVNSNGSEASFAIG